MKKIMIKKNEGITLIALVITIIVLLLLAGISISMLSGQDGILNKAKSAKENTIEAKALETIETTILTQRLNQLSEKNLDLEELEIALKDNLNADDVIVTEQEGIYNIDVTKNSQTKNYKVGSSEKETKTEEGLILYVELLKEQKGGESGLDTIVLQYTTPMASMEMTAKGFNFVYNDIEYTYILENNSSLFGYCQGVADTWIDRAETAQTGCTTTTSYDIKNNIVVEIPENLNIISGFDMSSRFAGVILCGMERDITFGLFQGGSITKELKIKGILTTIPNSTNVQLDSNCKIFYGGNTYNTPEAFFASFQ